jgi:enoyl-CoA hydratase/carnithine racemase
VSAPSEYQQILYDVSDGVATITLHRPDRLNAFTGTMMREMIAAFDRIDADDDVRAVIVTGSGRAYCAGADLSSGGGTFARGGSDVGSPAGVPRDGGGLTTLRIFECSKPVIGAINGAAVGVGVTMTLPMDIRVASTTARFGFVFARRGIVPEAASSYFLPRIVGISRAVEWCYTRPHLPGVGGARRWPRAERARTRRVDARGAGAGGRDRGELGAGVGRAHAPSAVADARRSPSDGGPPSRQQSDPVARGER